MLSSHYINKLLFEPQAYNRTFGLPWPIEIKNVTTSLTRYWIFTSFIQIHPSSVWQKIMNWIHASYYILDFVHFSSKLNICCKTNGDDWGNFGQILLTSSDLPMFCTYSGHAMCFGLILGQHLWQLSWLAWKHKNVNATYLLFILEGIKIA